VNKKTARPCGATVARLTPDQKVACSNHVGVKVEVIFFFFGGFFLSMIVVRWGGDESWESDGHKKAVKFLKKIF
jgi:hypothetical protein